MLVTVNSRLKFEIKVVHDLSCHPICLFHLHCYQITCTVSVRVVNGVLQYEVNSGMSAEAADRSSNVSFTAV